MSQTLNSYKQYNWYVKTNILQKIINVENKIILLFNITKPVKVT